MKPASFIITKYCIGIYLYYINIFNIVILCTKIGLSLTQSDVKRFTTITNVIIILFILLYLLRYLNDIGF